MFRSRQFAAVLLLVCSATVVRASTYDFLPIASVGAAASKYTSAHGAGVITVTDTFSAGGAGAFNNINTAIYPSNFSTLFPGTGNVQGHLAQTVYANTSVVTFDLTSYTGPLPTMAFGIWNTTDEVTAPAGSAVYRVALMDAGGTIGAPTTLNLLGNTENAGQVQSRHHLTMNTATGAITPGTLTDASGTHTDAAFWNNIPVGTKQIIVYADLPPLNNVGDGVGYYFAEVVVPEPASIALLGAGVLVLRRRR